MIAIIRFHAYPRIGFLSPHGLGIAAGYLIGGMLMVRHAAKRGIKADDVWNMLMRAVVGVIIGARLFYVVGHLNDYFGHGASALEILKVWKGGVVFYGGAIGGIVAAIPYLRKHGLRFVTVMDSTAAAFPLGLIFGRIGDIIVGDHLGGASNLPFAFRFYPYHWPVDYSKYVAHAFGQRVDPSPCFQTGCHQTALYDLVNVIILFAVVMFLQRKPRAKGFLIAFTTTWYGGARLITDFARDAQYYGIGPVKLHGTQWASIILILAGVWYLIRISRHGQRDEWPGLTPESIELAAEVQGSEGASVAQTAGAESAADFRNELGRESSPPADPEHFPDEGS